MTQGPKGQSVPPIDRKRRPRDEDLERRDPRETEEDGKNAAAVALGRKGGLASPLNKPKRRSLQV